MKPIPEISKKNLLILNLNTAGGMPSKILAFIKRKKKMVIAKLL